MKSYFLFVILIVAAFLRIINIENNPPALYGDELTIAYDSYSVLKTGYSQTGQFLPLTFEMGAGRPGGYVYSSIPFIGIFGPTATGVRMLSVLSGLGLIVLVFLLGTSLVSRQVGVIAAILMAISPWDLNLSRGGFEAHFAVFLATLGILTFILGVSKKGLWIVSALVFVLTIHTYPTFKLTLPLIIILLIWYVGVKKVWEKKVRGNFIAFVVILMLGVFLAIGQTFFGGSENRFLSINVFSQKDLSEKIIQSINEERNASSLPNGLKSLFHNKAISYGLILGEAYLDNLTPDFLFLHGDKNPRHNMSLMGGFYLIEFMTIVVGLFYFWKQNKRISFFLTAWILIVPLATALLLETHFLRNAFMLPPLIILSATGVRCIWVYRKGTIKNILVGVVAVAFLVQFLFLVERLYFLSPNRFYNFWSYPAKKASEIAIQNKNNFTYIIVSDKIDSIEQAYPVYAKIDPQQVIVQKDRWKQVNGQKFKKYDNVYIGYIPDSELDKFVTELSGSVLLIGSSFEEKKLTNYQTEKGMDGKTILVTKTKGGQ